MSRVSLQWAGKKALEKACANHPKFLDRAGAMSLASLKLPENPSCSGFPEFSGAVLS